LVRFGRGWSSEVRPNGSRLGPQRGLGTLLNAWSPTSRGDMTKLNFPTLGSDK
jgi:hypothetical protein